jgi:hypothetical protein
MVAGTCMCTHRLKSAESLRDEQAYAKLKKGQSFLLSAKAKFISQWSSTTIPSNRYSDTAHVLIKITIVCSPAHTFSSFPCSPPREETSACRT